MSGTGTDVLAQEYTIDVAGVTMTARAAQDDVVLHAPVPLDRFIVDAPGVPDVRLTVHYEDPPNVTDSDAEVFDSEGVWRLYRTPAGYTLTMSTTVIDDGRPFRAVLFDEALSEGHMYVRPLKELEARRLDDGRIPIVPWEYPLDELLVVNKIADGRGVNIHGCAISDRTSGRLFIGVSGAGKTTIARLWESQDVDVLSDDRLIVKPEGDEMWVFGTPWHGEGLAAMHVGLPLKAMYFLAKGPENRITPLTRMATVTRLLVCCFPTFYFKVGMENTVSLLMEIADKVPAYELAFVPDQGVIDLLLEHEV